MGGKIIEKIINSKIFRTYKIDYLGKYKLYTEDELKRSRNDGEYVKPKEF
ncbi:hypothetical protein [Clostridium septicum]|uniref:Uncharacterized protein n=1 Tax=Clostridium septicum TaxID=1504 RepID=A0ABY5B4F0_CLOSE|nr:hypothetical protein [Clostridium septicum]UEC19822.1 hypothetical protein LK444_10400 [Clostridium septicum]USS02118.1 hypothetical protein NH397_06765 [Clostridium septicum]